MQKSVLKGLQWLTGIVILIALQVSFVGYDRITTVLNFSDCDYTDLKEVLVERDSRNTGLNLKICKKDETLVIDMVSIAGDKSRTDVFRYILQTANELKAESFERVEFAYLGNSKFHITGSYFQKLGNEYEWQNAIFTTRTFPENIKNMDGTDALARIIHLAKKSVRIALSIGCICLWGCFQQELMIWRYNNLEFAHKILGKLI